MNPDSIVVEQIYSAPIAVVWQAITKTDHMQQWFFSSMSEFKPEIGFETQFDVQVEGQNYAHQWKVTEIVPEKKITYGWQYDGYPGNSSVTWELSETHQGTKLKLTHKGTESFPQDNPIFSREAGESGWRYFICESLKLFLERQYS